MQDRIMGMQGKEHASSARGPFRMAMSKSGMACPFHPMLNAFCCTDIPQEQPIQTIAEMAAAWGMPTSGAWAQQVDEEEKDSGGQLEEPKAAPVATFSQNAAFPTLGEAVKKKDSKKDKKAKPQKMNLADFQTSYKPPTASRRTTVPDDQILSSLPTAPRTRGDDEPSTGLGGAFKDYGGRDRGEGIMMVVFDALELAMQYLQCPG